MLLHKLNLVYPLNLLNVTFDQRNDFIRNKAIVQAVEVPIKSFGFLNHIKAWEEIGM